MRGLTQILVIAAVGLISVTAQAYMRSEEEIAESNKAEAKIQRTIEGFSKNLSGEVSSKYKILRKALEAYAVTHGENEANAPGTGWSDVVRGKRIAILKEFIDLFNKLDSQQLNVRTDQEFKQKDEEINRLYQALQKNKDLDNGVAAQVNRSDIKTTQRSWIKYRDAWLAFSTVRFPTVSVHSLNFALTADRVSILKEITQEVKDR